MLFIGYVDENDDVLKYTYARKISSGGIMLNGDYVAILGNPDGDWLTANMFLRVDDIFSIEPSDGRLICVRGANGENTILQKWHRQNHKDWVGDCVYEVLETDKECDKSKYSPDEYIRFNGSPTCEAILDVHLTNYPDVGRKAKKELVSGVKILEVHRYPEDEICPIWYKVETGDIPIEIPERFVTFCY
jgi:hypothetical protein